MSKSIHEILGIADDDPDYIAALAEAEAQYARAEIRRCANGCTNYYDPVTKEVFAGFGRAGCAECNAEEGTDHE